MGLRPTPILTILEVFSPKALWQACHVGLRATMPPQTLGDPGTVKPNTCPCNCHVLTCTHAHTRARAHARTRETNKYAMQSTTPFVVRILSVAG